MQYDPADRYDSAAELAADLRRHLQHQPISAGNQNALYHARKFAMRHLGTIIAACVVCMAIIAGTIASGIGLLRAEKARQEATRQWHRAEQEKQNFRRERNLANVLRLQAEGEADKAKQFANLVEEIIGAADPDQGYPAEFTVRQHLDMISADIGESLSEYPLAEARMRRLIGRLYQSMREYAKAEPQLQRALELHQKHLSRDDSRVIASQVDYATSLFFVGRAEESLDLLLPALERLRIGKPSAEYVEALFLRQRIHAFEDEFEDSAKLLHDAWIVSQNVHGKAHPISLRYQAQASRQLVFDGQYAEAEALATTALNTITEIRPDRHVDVAFIKEQVAFVLFSTGQLARADRKASEAITTFRELLGDDSPYVITGLVLLSKIKSELGDSDSALELSRQAGQLADSILVGNGTAKRSAYQRLATLTRDIAPAESISARGKALKVQVDYFPHKRGLAYNLSEFAFRLRRLGELDQAKLYYEHAIRFLRQGNPSEFMVLRSLHSFADLLREMGDPETAANQLREVLNRDVMTFPNLRLSRMDSARMLLEIELLECLLESGQSDAATERITQWTLSQEDLDAPLSSAMQQALLATKSMAEKDHQNAEQQLRQSLQTISESVRPIRLITKMSCMIARCQIEQGNFDAAEKRLLHIEKTISRRVFFPIDRRRVRATLVELYKRWSKPEQVQQWRDEMIR